MLELLRYESDRKHIKYSRICYRQASKAYRFYSVYSECNTGKVSRRKLSMLLKTNSPYTAMRAAGTSAGATV